MSNENEQYAKVIEMLLDIDKAKSKEIRELQTENNELHNRIEDLNEYIKEREL